MGIIWIYLLKEEELIDLLRQVQEDTTITLKVLRQRYVAYVKAHPEMHNLKTILEGYDENKDIMRDELLDVAEQRQEEVAGVSSPQAGDQEAGETIRSIHSY